LAAVTNENSDLMANILATPAVFNSRHLDGAYVRRKYFNCLRAVTGGDGSYFRLCQLPAGAMVVLGDSKVTHSDWGGTVVALFGWEAYTDADGTPQVADPDGLVSSLDLSGAADAIGKYLAAGTIGAGGAYKTFNGAVVLTASVSTGEIPAAATLRGWITYAMPSD
jgi:hypothetical protein